MTMGTWQKELFERLRANPNDWFMAGQLFDEFRMRIPMHTAMRYVHARYADGTMPSFDKAQWLYFSNLMRSKTIGVEVQGHIRHATWVYSTEVRLKRLGECHCGGQLIKHAYGSNVSFCLGCGEESRVPRRKPKVVTFPIRSPKQQPLWSPNWAAAWQSDEQAAPEIEEEIEESTPEIEEEIEESTPEIEEQPEPPKQLTPEPSNVVPFPLTLELPEVPAGIAQIHAPKTAKEQTALLAAGCTPILRLDQHTFISEVKKRLVIGYKNQLFLTVRDLARHLAAILRPLSINRIETELQRCGYRPAVLLAKYNINDDIRSEVTIHNQKVVSFAQLANELKNRS